MMKKYSYSGPLSGVSLGASRGGGNDDGGGGGWGGNGGEVLLAPGTEVELPSDSPYTRALVARGHLKLVEGGNSAVKQQKNREDV